MIEIDVPKTCGDDLITRNAGRKVRDVLLENWEQDVIEIRFSGRRIASVSFFDEAIGLLLKRGGKTMDEITSKLRFPDIHPGDRRLLNSVLRARLDERESAS